MRRSYEISPERVRKTQFDHNSHIRRQNGIDLIDSDPRSLTLMERMRQKRQLERAKMIPPPLLQDGEIVQLVLPSSEFVSIPSGPNILIPDSMDLDEEGSTEVVIQNDPSNVNLTELTPGEWANLPLPDPEALSQKSNLKPISSFTRNEHEENALQDTIIDGKIPAIILNDGWHALPEDIQRYLHRYNMSHYKRPTEKPELPSVEERGFLELFNKIKENIIASQSPQRQEVIRLVETEEDTPIAELAKGLGYSRANTLSDLLTRIRQEAEPQFTQAGIVKVVSFNDPRLRTAAYDGRLISGRFLRIPFTNQEEVDIYDQLHSQKLNEELLKQGYIPVGSLPSAEMQMLRKTPKFREMLRVEDKRDYILCWDLEDLRNGNIPFTSINFPGPDYELLSERLRDPDQRERFLYGVRNGWYNAKQNDEGWWFALPDDTDAFLIEDNKKRR